MQDDPPPQAASVVENIVPHMTQLSIMAPSNLNHSHIEPIGSSNSNQTSASNMSSPEVVRQMKSPTPTLAPSTLPPAVNLHPSISFPWQPPPSGLTVRLKPLLPALAALDKKTGLLPAAEFQDEIGEEEAAARLLEQHRQSRMPYVHLSSQRLQAVVGEKNDWNFGEFLCFSLIFWMTVVSSELFLFADLLSLSLFCFEVRTCEADMFFRILGD